MDIEIFEDNKKIVDLQEVREAELERLAHEEGFVNSDEVVCAYFSKVLLQTVRFKISESSMRVTLPIKTDVEKLDDMLKEQSELISLFGEGWYSPGVSCENYDFAYKTKDVFEFIRLLEVGLKGLVENKKIRFD